MALEDIIINEVVVEEEIQLDYRVGVDGVTFTPQVTEVSNEETILSFTNNGDKPNPEPTNIKGKAFTYDDFTPAQIESLQQPALDAAAIANAATNDVLEAEEVIQANEALRISAEIDRNAAEILRDGAEETRVTSEILREQSESIRKNAEILRNSSEVSRNNAELLRDSAEQTRINNEEGRVDAEVIRESNEDSRKANELIRIASESTRVNNELNRQHAEHNRTVAESDRVDAEILRESSEGTRESNEVIRQENEVLRVSAENTRISNEGDATSGRIKAENDRVAADIIREEVKEDMLELNFNPPKLFDISGRLIWHYWDLTSHSYVSTGLPGAFNFVSSNLESYQKYDVVQVNETSYISLVDNNTSTIEEGTNWKIIAKVGRTPQFEMGSITTTEEGTDATATITLTGYDEDQNPQYTVDYSIPRGYSGVYVGESEPVDPTVKVWVDPDGEENYPISSVFGTSQTTSSSQNLLTRSASYLNITKLFPLSSGYYTSTTARTAVPVAVRFNGLVISYETASGVWYCERFIGASVTTWTTATDWEVVPNKKYVDDADALINASINTLKVADTKQQDSIQQIENTLNAININQEATATLADYGTLALPKTAANGGMSVKLEGLTAENLVVNGDFRNGLSGWTIYAGGTPVIEPGYVKYTPISVIGAISNGFKQLSVGNKWYLRTIVKSSSPVVASVGFAKLNVGTQLVTGNIGTSDTTISGILTIANADINEFVVGRPTTVQDIYIKNACAINLTATFGAGNEPDLATCNKMFANYFDGVKHFVAQGRLRSVGKNILNINPFGKKIFTGQVDGMTTAQRILYYDIIAGITRDGVINSSRLILNAIDGIKLEITALSVGYGVGFKFKAKAGEIFARRETVTGGGQSGFSFYDSNGVNIYNTTSSTATAPSATAFGILVFAPNTLNTNIIYTGLQLERGSIVTSYEPYTESALYLNSPALRSNGSVKDEIRKGVNGYEHVKRVGVGTLGANGITGGDFEGGLVGNKVDGGGSVSTWQLNTTNPISGAKDGRLIVSTAGTDSGRPYITIYTGRQTKQLRKLTFSYKVNSGTCILNSIFAGGSSIIVLNTTFTGTGTFSLYYIAEGTEQLAIYFDGRNLFDVQIDNLKDELINTADGAATGNVAIQFSDGTIFYTLAAPVITPIAYGGLLNSNSNGTVYREKVIADAGVYSDKLSIQLTDYPISSFETIIKRSNGVETILNNATAVIAANGLSFTHPDLVSGDLVLFTYYFANESTEGKTTLTYYDSRYVIADTANGKFYKTSIRSTNGVASIILTEV